ncbi:hypothetical protein MKX03_023108 [Papaver bracteatum]|nr:hypothetical protein MKX03_023108 [Papaver bracteatum]
MSLANNSSSESGSGSSIPLLCKKGCGFFGSKSTMDMCSNKINDCQENKPKEDSHVNKATEKLSSCASITTDSVVLNNRCSTCNKRVWVFSHANKRQKCGCFLDIGNPRRILVHPYSNLDRYDLAFQSNFQLLPHMK